MLVRFVVPTSVSTAPLCTHNVRDAKPIADFNQLAARNDYFFAPRQRVQNQKNCRRVVVHHQRSLAPNKLGEEVVRMNVAFTTLAAREVILEIRIPFGHLGDLSERFRRGARPCSYEESLP